MTAIIVIGIWIASWYGQYYYNIRNLAVRGINQK